MNNKAHRWAYVLRRLSIVGSAVVAASVAFSALGAALPPLPEGEVRFHQTTRSSFDSYTDDPTPDEQAWMREHYDRMQVFTPYFDSRLSWYPDAWVYRSAYAIFPGSQTLADNPDWVLRDAQDNMLYIPFDCTGSSCPQFAGDFGNPAFRANWIARLAELLAEGYIGVWIDDVNLDWRVSDGNGDFVQPIDPRTGELMTLDDWQRYFAEFVEEIRLAFPQIEIAHNTLWLAATPALSNIHVDRQIDATDYVNLERGATDQGLIGGSGPFGFETFLAYIDYVHGRGRSVILMDEGETLIERELALAAWFLVSQGSDLMSSENLDWTAPDRWWFGYDLDLGAAAGPRYDFNGLMRRDFACGSVFVNMPDAQPVSAPLAEYYTDLDNAPVESVDLDPASASILLSPCVEVANVTDTTAFGSPDPSGLTYLPTAGTLLLSDSEVNETPFFTGSNLFELALDGTLVDAASTLDFSAEPTGVTFNTAAGSVFVVDDDLSSLFEADLSGATPQLLNTQSLAALGIPDPEGVSFDSASGNLFVVDGTDGPLSTKTLYEVTLAGQVVSSLPLGVTMDPEGVFYDPVRDTFFVVTAPEQSIVEISRTGAVVAAYDLQPLVDVYGTVVAKGVTMAPTSNPDDDPAARNLYVADYGLDETDDGRLFEISLNHPPVGDADADAIPDSFDNCTQIANPNQRDSNGDGFGNRCDADLNGDCITNPIDLGIFRSVFFSTDADADLDGDGVVNPIDLGIFRSLFFLPPGPAATPNLCTP